METWTTGPRTGTEGHARSYRELKAHRIWLPKGDKDGAGRQELGRGEHGAAGKGSEREESEGVFILWGQEREIDDEGSRQVVIRDSRAISGE